MHVPSFIRQLPNQMNHIFTRVGVQTTKMTQWITNYWKTKWNSFSQSDFWQQHGKPFYERNIQPLDKTDCLLLGGSSCIAIFITIFAVNKWTVATFPLALGVGTLIVTCAWSHSRNRIQQKFNNIAWESLDRIRRIAHNITPQNQQFGDIAEQRAFLKQVKFQHLDSDMKELDEAIRTFKNAVLSPNTANLVDSKQEFIKCIQGLQNKWASHLIIENLSG